MCYLIYFSHQPHESSRMGVIFALLDATFVTSEILSDLPLVTKELNPDNFPKGNQSWMFIGRTDAEAETPILWPPGVKNWLIGKDPDAGKDWRQEEKGITEGEMVGWHHRLDGHEFEQAVGVGDGQRGLACCSPCGRKESDTTEQLNLSCVATNLVTLALKRSSFLSHFPKLPQHLPLWSRSERVKFKKVVVRSANWSIHLCLTSTVSAMQGGSLFT